MNKELIRNWFRQSWFFILYLALAAGYAIITPPLRGPDERNHFLRSYEISELRFFPHRLSDGFVGDELPAGLFQLSEALGAHNNPAVSSAELTAARAVTLQPDKRIPIEFSNSALYAPGVYLPAATAILIGRVMGLSPLHLLCLARAANVLAASLLVALAVSRAPYARWPAMLVALIPMSVSQTALITADAFTFSVSFLWIALIIDWAISGAGPLRPKSWALLLAVAIFLAQLRPPYPLLVALLLIVSPSRIGLGRANAVVYASIVLAAVIPALAWNIWAQPLFVPEKDYPPPLTQLESLRKKPRLFFRAVKYHLAQNSAKNWSEAVGRFEWLNIPLPAWVTTGYAVSLLLGCFVGRPNTPQPKPWQRAVIGAVALGGIGAIHLLLYITYNLAWIQGRYFIPFFMVAAFALAVSIPIPKPVRFAMRSACIGFALLANLVSLLAIARAGTA